MSDYGLLCMGLRAVHVAYCDCLQQQGSGEDAVALHFTHAPGVSQAADGAASRWWKCNCCSEGTRMYSMYRVCCVVVYGVAYPLGMHAAYSSLCDHLLNVSQHLWLCCRGVQEADDTS